MPRQRSGEDYVRDYNHALDKTPTLAIKRGIEPMPMANPDIPQYFGLGGISAFRNFNSVVGRELLTVEDDTGTPIEVTNKQRTSKCLFHAP